MRLLFIFAAVVNLFAALINSHAYLYHGWHWYNLFFIVLNGFLTIWMVHYALNWKPVR